MDNPSRVRIAADSMADIPAALASELGIAVTPATITFGEETYLEGVNLSRDGFYDRLLSFPGLPKSAAPGPGAFASTYMGLIAENRQAGVPVDGILSFHPPAALSGLYNSAYSGSQMVEGTRIVVIDSGQISMGTGFMAVLAARAAREGRSLDEIVEIVEDAKRHTLIIAALETLEWAARSGRINPAIAALGNLLSVKPILRVQGGSISLAERVRTRGRQIERVVEIGRSWAPYREVAVMHGHAAADAAKLVDRISDIYPRERIVVAEIGCILGSYTGPGVCGIVAVRE